MKNQNRSNIDEARVKMEEARELYLKHQSPYLHEKFRTCKRLYEKLLFSKPKAGKAVLTNKPKQLNLL